MSHVIATQVQIFLHILFYRMQNQRESTMNNFSLDVTNRAYQNKQLDFIYGEGVVETKLSFDNIDRPNFPTCGAVGPA